MRQLLFDAYNRSPDFVYNQIRHLQELPALPGQEKIKQKTLADLHVLLQSALINDCQEHIKNDKIRTD